MSTSRPAPSRVQVNTKQVFGLLGPYVKSRLVAQIQSVWLIVAYLILFQTLVLQIPIAQAGMIALGLSLVVAGLTFFMEGLFLGLMPLGEVIGVKLPQKSKLPIILAFAFILGVGATLAEPAIGVLKAAGAGVRAWEAPLLFVLLNKYSGNLVNAVGGGVGLAVLFGMLRFLYSWSLKPFIYVLVGILLAFSILAVFDPNMRAITGLAWDCGAVTTGPVTVPLVLALGIGICRIVGSAGSGSAGFGVVTLASLFPIIAVLSLGLPYRGGVPDPMDETRFFSSEFRPQVESMFESADAMKGYALLNTGYEAQRAVFDGDERKMADFLSELKRDDKRRRAVFGAEPDAMERWAVSRGSEVQKLAIFDDMDSARAAAARLSAATSQALDVQDLLKRNGIAALQAIIPLSLFMMLALVALLREKLPRADEIMVGILFAIVGMGIFSIGIELGLARLGTQVGGKLPSSFKAIELADQKQAVSNFNRDLVFQALDEKGRIEEFFYLKKDKQVESVPFRDGNLDSTTAQYTYTPTKGPLFGREGSIAGILVVLLFAFLMGYGATLAEPALNALGTTVEELTVGTFKKSLLMQAVALGVGIGITFGVAKIIWDIPLVYILIPPYLVTLTATILSSEEFVNIGWDSAGVTTGPITVPLVLAMGLGISSQVGVVEGFGILAMASVWPILSVLMVGLMVNRRRAALLKTEEAQAAPGA